ncbi:MAG: hypothetical protein H6594_06325 [Flavobacteriales bacterium]|nr:hypothetical protein [Flavobacteriales bacterium]
MKHHSLLLLVVLSAPVAVQAQCVYAQDTCAGAVDASTILVNGTLFSTDSYACFYVGPGDSLSVDAINNFIMVESGGKVNVNGVNNVVLAKAGASVAFCGSGYNNFVDHEPGLASQLCMSGNIDIVCAQVTIIGPTGIGERQDAGPVLSWSGDVLSLIHCNPGAVLVEVVDLQGRIVARSPLRSEGSLRLDDLAHGLYTARVPERPDVPPLRFVR